MAHDVRCECCRAARAEAAEWRGKALQLAAAQGEDEVDVRASHYVLGQKILADRIRRERAEAWEEGYCIGIDDFDHHHGRNTVNPYREGGDDER